jgi:hypothetical protein
MEEQSDRKFASADSTARAQDATFQDRSLCAEIRFNPRRRLQHLNVQRQLISDQSHRMLRAATMTTWRDAVAAA